MNRGGCRVLLALAASGALGASSAQAQLLRPRLEIAPYVGGFFTGELDVHDLADAPILGARAGVRLPGGVGVEGQFGYVPLESEVVAEVTGNEAVAFDLTAWLYEAGVTWSLPLPGPLAPFLGVAVGQARFDPDLEVAGQQVEDETSLTASAGVGVRLSVPGVRLRADLRDHLVLDALGDTSAALGSEEGGSTLQAIEASLGISLLL